jgi:transcriptional regulator with XRE-family HTH domain
VERLAELRESQALTLRDLAERSGVDANTINQVELGHRKPRPSTLRKLAKALDVEVREFFEEPVPLGEAPVEGRPRITAEQALEMASIDPYPWIQHKTTEELQQIALEAAQFTKTGTYEDLIRNKDNKELHLEVPRRRVMARTLIRNVIGELELRGAPSSQVKLVLKKFDDVMNPPEETSRQGHEERQGKETG